MSSPPTTPGFNDSMTENTAAALPWAMQVDARGLNCPLPLLRAKQALHRIESGECLCVLATDSGSVRDFHAFAKLSGHILVEFQQSDGEYRYLLRKAGQPK
jgi:tRNA 2-thiouridine synthesizing protein A